MPPLTSVLLANTSNHCYANSIIQALFWLSTELRDEQLKQAQEVSKLARITAGHSSVRHEQGMED